MLSNKKNIIVGERSNLFAVSPLRFLIIIFCLILSLRAQSLKACHVERSRDAGNESGYDTEKEIRNILFDTIHGDSIKNKYDINDPRNPQCPCHIYQKQADEEYNKLQKKQGNLFAYSVGNEIFSDNSVTKKHHISFTKFKRKHGAKKFYKIKVLFSKEYWKKWRASTEVTDCFNW